MGLSRADSDFAGHLMGQEHLILKGHIIPKVEILPVQKMARNFEQGRYIVTDAHSGMALDLSGADNRSLIAFGFHGWENQQARPIRPSFSLMGFGKC